MIGAHLHALPARAKLWTEWPSAGPLGIALLLLCLGIANITARANWREVEDGVLWAMRAEGVVAEEIAAGGPAARAGLKPGDLLLSIDNHPVQDVSEVVQALHAGEDGTMVRYTILRLDTRDVIEIRLAPLPNAPAALYFLLAAVGIFTLLVGTAVRLRRPRDPATLHFFWLTVVFFGAFTFSFSGRLDRLDWVFYWSDVVSILVLPPLFVHFALVFPERSHRWDPERMRWIFIPLIYCPAALLGLTRIAALTGEPGSAPAPIRVIGTLDRVELLYLACCLIAGLVVFMGALRRVGSITARRQLRWIAWGTALGATPFALVHALPFAAGFEPNLPMQLSVLPLGLIPLAYACAIVRYRLMDVEVIVKRALVYAAALSAIVAIYAVLLQLVERVVFKSDAEHNWIIALLATLVAVLLAPPVKEAVQNTLDRAFYRDRYDYRRALVGFARDLNSDLDLSRLADRLVSRVVETLLVERMALMLADEGDTDFASVKASGIDEPPPLPLESSLGLRLRAGEVVALDDPMAVSRFPAEEIEFWRDAGLFYFVPCVAKEGPIAVLALGRKDTGEPLSSEDMALLAAVAGQIATALENARLYSQLQVKALEVDRMRAFNENILESLDDGLLVVDLDDRVVRWNTALAQMYGIPRADAIGQSLDALFQQAFVGALRAARRDFPFGTTLSRVPLTRRGAADNRALLLNAAVVPLRASEGRDPVTVGTIVILEDITSRAQLEEQLQISEKMASIGLLAAGVAHEVNTPLTGISSFTQMLLDGADPADPRTRLLEKIERQTFRAAKIVNSLLNLSRAPSGAQERATVDVNAIVGDVLSLLEHQLEIGKIKVRRELVPEAATVVGAEHKLQQVFLNLFLNARDAMPRGGWLSITTRVESDQVVAEVSDTGSGIPPEHLARIYDPFFTTKTMGHGTGLGLSITYGIVREHEGSLLCESTVGQGTRFIVGFPRVDAASAVAAQIAN